MDNKNTTQFTWTEFYVEFADKLLLFKDDRKKLIQIIKESFDETNQKFPFMDKGTIVEDICPFSIFGSFNKGLSNKNRKIIAKSLGEKLEVTSNIPDDFEGIPVLNNMSSWFFWGRDARGEDDIDNLWKTFENSIKYADNNTEKAKADFKSFYDKVLNQNGVKWNLTMGLYWIRPFFYINLDSRNRNYLLMENSPYYTEVKKISDLKEVPSAEEYMQIIDLLGSKFKKEDALHKSFPEVSRGAWLTSQEDKTDSVEYISSASFLKWFSPIIEALKKLEGSATPDQVRDQIVGDLNLSDDTISEVRGKSSVNKFKNEVAFARNYLVYAGYIDKSNRGIWQLTKKGWNEKITKRKASDIFRKYAKELRKSKKNKDVKKKKYWIYSAGRRSHKWDEFYNEEIMGIDWSGTDNIANFNSRAELIVSLKNLYGDTSSYKNTSLALWQFANDMNIGDIVYVKRGTSTLVGRGIVESDYIFDENKKEFKHIRKVKWTHNGEWDHSWHQAVLKTLTDLSSYTEYVNRLELLFAGEDEEADAINDSTEEDYPLYTDEDFLKEVFLSESKYHRLVNVLKVKKNVILQGPPGVGKTFSAKRIAYSIIGSKDIGKVMLIQFHQNYSYEDFVMGYRPDGQGFKLVEGPFYEFCKGALDDEENDYFFIIDEINRGNLSKIFGELLMLIENDKRGHEIRLMYSNELFSVPSNVHIIGMMNTADRSLAMIDYALRRRFSFFNFEPSFDSAGFKDILLEANNQKFNKLIEVIKELNLEIAKDESLGDGFQIGHSYFCPNIEVDDEWLMSVVEYEIIPLLKEYWFDETSKITSWINRLFGVLK